MKKFTMEKFSTNVICLESFVECNKEVNVIALESMQGFFTGIKSKLGDMFTNTEGEMTLVKELDSNRSRVTRITNNITLYDVNGMTVVTPENFKGNIVSFADDLVASYVFLEEELRDCIVSVKNDLGYSLNNSGVEDFSKPNSLKQVRDFKRKREIFQAKLSGYFKGTGNHSEFKDIMRSPKDVGLLYERISIFNAHFKSMSAKSIKTLVDSLIVDIDAYIELLEGLSDRKTNALIASKEVSEIMLELAHALEFFGYVQANILQIAGTVSSIAKGILNK